MYNIIMCSFKIHCMDNKLNHFESYTILLHDSYVINYLFKDFIDDFLCQYESLMHLSALET